MNQDKRAVIEAIAFGTDARITPSDRLRALEMLSGAPEADERTLAMFADVQKLSGEALDRELAGYMDPGELTWQTPPDPDGEPMLADQWGEHLVAIAAGEDPITRFPRLTAAVAAMAERMLPSLDEQRMEAAVAARLDEHVAMLRRELTAQQQPQAAVVPLHRARTSDRVQRPEPDEHQDRRVPPGLEPADWHRSWGSPTG